MLSVKSAATRQNNALHDTKFSFYYWSKFEAEGEREREREREE